MKYITNIMTPTLITAIFDGGRLAVASSDLRFRQVQRTIEDGGFENLEAIMQPRVECSKPVERTATGATKVAKTYDVVQAASDRLTIPADFMKDAGMHGMLYTVFQTDPRSRFLRICLTHRHSPQSCPEHKTSQSTTVTPLPSGALSLRAPVLRMARMWESGGSYRVTTVGSHLLEVRRA